MSATRSYNEAVRRAGECRAEILRSWLHSVGAACLWQQRVARVGMLEAWSANGRIFLLQHFAHHASGFELYIPASESNRTDETLAAAAKYLRGEK